MTCNVLQSISNKTKQTKFLTLGFLSSGSIISLGRFFQRWINSGTGNQLLFSYTQQQIINTPFIPYMCLQNSASYLSCLNAIWHQQSNQNCYSFMTLKFKDFSSRTFHDHNLHFQRLAGPILMLHSYTFWSYEPWQYRNAYIITHAYDSRASKLFIRVCLSKQ